MANIIITLHSKKGGYVDKSYMYDTETAQMGHTNSEALYLAQYGQFNNLNHRDGFYTGIPILFANVTMDSRSNFEPRLAVGAGLIAPNTTDHRSGSTAGVTIRFPVNTTINDPEPTLQLVRHITEAYERLMVSGGAVQGQRTYEAFAEIVANHIPPELIKEVGRTIVAADPSIGPFKRQRAVAQQTCFDYAVSLPDALAQDRDRLAAASNDRIISFLTGREAHSTDSIAVSSATNIRTMGVGRVALSETYDGRLPLRAAAADIKPPTAPPVVASPESAPAVKVDPPLKPAVVMEAQQAAREVLFPKGIAVQAITELQAALGGPNGEAARTALTELNASIQSALAGGTPKVR